MNERMKRENEGWEISNLGEVGRLKKGKESGALVIEWENSEGNYYATTIHNP